MRQQISPMSVVAATLIGLGMLVVGCGQVAPKPSQGPPRYGTIAMAIPTGVLIWAPVLLAQAEGYFAKEGVSVALTETNGAPIAISAVLSGSAQVAGGALSDAFSAAVQGKPLVAFASVVTRNGDDIVATKAFASKVGLTSSSPIAEKVKALKGATLGIVSTGDITQEYFDWLLRKYGVNPSGETFVPFPTPAAALGALAHNEVDALVYPAPVPNTAIAAGSAIMWVNTAEGEVSPPYWVGLMTTPTFIKTHSAAIRAVARAVEAALVMIKTHPAQAESAVRPYFASLTSSQFAASWNVAVHTYATSAAITAAQVTGVEGYVRSLGIEVPNLPVSSLADTSLASALHS